MKAARVIIILLIVALSGCSTTSPYVGKWTSDELPNIEAKMEVIINDDGTLSFMLNSEDGSDTTCISGTWTAVSTTTMKIDIPGEESGTGKILDKNTMEITGEGDTYKIKKK